MASRKRQSLSNQTKRRIRTLHRESLQRAVASEVIALELLSRPVKRATSDTVAAAALGSGKKSDTMRGVRGAAAALASEYETEFQAAMGHARRLAMIQVEREALEAQALLKQLTGAEVDLAALRGVVRSAGAAEDDAVKAYAAATSAANKWTNKQLREASEWSANAEPSSALPRRLARATRELEKTRAMHASIMFDAYAEQHHEVWKALAESPFNRVLEQPQAFETFMDPSGTGPEKGLPFGWHEGMFEIWSAILDRRTCSICFDADGAMVPVGKPFPWGVPGTLHPRCRCVPVATFIPEAMANKLPGIQIDYEELKGDIRDFMRESRGSVRLERELSYGNAHAQAYIRDALDKSSPQALTKRLVERRYFGTLFQHKSP